MEASWSTAWFVSLSLVVQLIQRATCIDCFKCASHDGSDRDCEDDFGPPEKHADILRRDCKQGPLKFKAHYCVKIKGVKENGQSIVIRTCSMTDWGTQCGDLWFEQGNKKEAITGCLASCNMDGCNGAKHIHQCMTRARTLLFLVILHVVLLLWNSWIYHENVIQLL